ncbi:MAG: RnfABCDGE type electron transport complex subunit D [Ruminococcus sp.]|nr:RnfABCDGE type electron transport complex subunit D [Ruminococcus sp.]
MSKLFVSSSPHLRATSSTRRIMLDVIISLLPASAASVVFFGWRALMLIGVCVFTCVFTEYICRIVMKRSQTIGDLSAAVTGLILALNLPSTLNPLIAIFGSVAAIVVVKQMFGGIGMNFVNPAMAARIILMVSFPTAMTNWVNTQFAGVDAVSSATPMAAEAGTYSYMELLFGNHGGSMGETCAVALILGGIYLVARRVISPVIPVVYIGTTAVLSFVLGQNPVQQVLSGGLLLGAVFMATDYTTSPITKWGKVVYAVGCGVMTVLIRTYAELPEGVSFSILLMNILTPLIESITTPKPFGASKEGKK